MWCKQKPEDGMNYITGEDVPAFGPGVVMSLVEREACSGTAMPV